MNTKTLAYVLLGGAALWFLLGSQRSSYKPYPGGYYQGKPIPPSPPYGSPQWAQWAQLIVATFGKAAELWQPGGPLYGAKNLDYYECLATPGMYWDDAATRCRKNGDGKPLDYYECLATPGMYWDKAANVCRKK